ncbi:MAG TPA: hypothetical protein VG826_10235 [Pirellulales bacterium]|nr:hypothetical protein [Pirellulales bacterium]
MRNILSATLVAVFTCGFSVSAQSAEDDAKSVIEKAIKALGGEEKLSAAKGLTWKTKGAIRFGDNENNYTAEATASGLDRIHDEFEGDFGGNQFKAVLVIDGDKGWRKFGDTSMELSAEDLDTEKRRFYLQIISTGNLLPLKTKDFKVESAGEEKVGDAEASVIKVTAPDGKDFKLFFDKMSNLPVKLVATVRGFMGEDFTQESLYLDFKDFDGIKRATKHVVKRDGMTFIEAKITDFKVLDKVDPETFAEPK